MMCYMGKPHMNRHMHIIWALSTGFKSFAHDNHLLEIIWHFHHASHITHLFIHSNETHFQTNESYQLNWFGFSLALLFNEFGSNRKTFKKDLSIFVIFLKLKNRFGFSVFSRKNFSNLNKKKTLKIIKQKNDWFSQYRFQSKSKTWFDFR